MGGGVGGGAVTCKSVHGFAKGGSGEGGEGGGHRFVSLHNFEVPHPRGFVLRETVPKITIPPPQFDCTYM